MKPTKETPGEFARLLKSYRSKIRRYVAPGTTFSLELVMGCSTQDLFEYVESNRRPGMDWREYGRTWFFSNMESPKSYDLTDSEQFLSYFNYRSFRPVFVTEAEGVGSKSQGWPTLRTGQQITPPTNPHKK